MGLGDARARGGETAAVVVVAVVAEVVAVAVARWERLVRLSARAMMSASRASRSRSERQRSYAKRLARAPTRRSGEGPSGLVGLRQSGRPSDVDAADARETRG